MPGNDVLDDEVKRRARKARARSKTAEALVDTRSDATIARCGFRPPQAMAYQVLARKYRPQRFADVAGQDHVTVTLMNALTQGRIAHGYIFSGHRGIGKTTIARILAMALNCRNAIGSAGASHGRALRGLRVLHGDSRGKRRRRDRDRRGDQPRHR